jgi:hypothetical protein
VAIDTQAKLIQLAEDQLAEYSTRALKFERLRPKINLLLSVREREALKGELTQTLAEGGELAMIVEKNRQTVALPFWGLAGLGMLAGFLDYRLGWVLAIAGVWIAFALQRWGWQRLARRLLLACLEDMGTRQN